jgi:hypothetical protein
MRLSTANGNKRSISVYIEGRLLIVSFKKLGPIRKKNGIAQGNK